VSGYFRDDETGQYVVSFNPKMAKLYEAGHTLIDWSERKALGQPGQVVAWAICQPRPFPYKVETLRDERQHSHGEGLQAELKRRSTH
jgi:hypothetical protein